MMLIRLFAGRAVLQLVLAALILVPQVSAAGAQSVDAKLIQAMEWRLVGPFRGGRVTAVAGHADQPTTYYMGATGGGVWKTTNAGTTWENISDGYFNTVTIGAIAVAPSDPNIVYVGTGEAPVRGVTTSHGDGVYKSTDGGKTWTHLADLRDTRQISAIRIHPENPDLVYVAAQGNPWGPGPARGVYRSRDGGESFDRILFVNDTTGPHGLDMDAHNPGILYAGMWDHQRRPWTVRSGGPGSGLWKSTDGGDNWTAINRGLPELMGNTNVVVSPADPNRLYAMIEATEGGIFRSDNAGASWRRVNDDPGIRDRGWYYTHIFAHPTDPDQLYVLAASMVTSTDGGQILNRIRTPHGDNHGLWINPKHPELMIESNDGGANVSLDGGQTWSTQMNQPTAQFYRVITDNVFPYRLYAGQQDNSSVRIPSRTMSGSITEHDWRDVGGGESAQFGFDPDNPRLVYGTSLLGTISEYDDETGEVRQIPGYPYFAGFRSAKQLKYRFNWNAPVAVSMHDPSVIYHGAQLILKSTDRGRSWTEFSPDLTRAEEDKMGTTGGPITIEGAGGEHYATLMYIAESPHDAAVVWAGSDDGLVHVTRDGGQTWQDVTPRRMGEAQVNAIDVSPHDPAKAYIAVTKYKLNDLTPLIYKTDDYGASWDLITDGIPADNFARVVREDTEQAGLLYAGTESGVFVSFDDGDNWQPLQLNLPEVPITDLRVHDDDLVAATQGRAFWILDGLEPLRQLAAEGTPEGTHLFAPAPALRLNGGGFPVPGGANPPYGAVIYYSLAADAGSADGPVTLDIMDDEGQVLRSFSSRPPESGGEGFVKGVQGEPPAPPMTTRGGLNRYVWNLRVEPIVPTADTIRYVSSRPYRVAPGQYQARLTYNGETLTQAFEVRDEPGKPAMAEGWTEEQHLVRRLYNLTNAVHRASNQTRSLAAQARKIAALAAGRPEAIELNAMTDVLVATLKKWEDHVPQPPIGDDREDRIAFPSHLLSTQILHVMSIVDQGPPVGREVSERVGELEAQWADIASRRDEILANDVADYNAFLAEHDLGRLILPSGDEPAPRP